MRNVVAPIPESVGGGNGDYDTIQLGFNKRFGSGLFIQASYDYQWRDELRQNSASNSPLNSDPLGVNYYQNVFPEVPNRQESTNWQGRLMGRYVFPYEFGFAVNFRAQSGWQWARLIQVALPNAGTYRAWLSTSTTDAWCHVQGLSGKKSNNCGVANPPNQGSYTKRGFSELRLMMS